MTAPGHNGGFFAMVFLRWQIFGNSGCFLKYILTIFPRTRQEHLCFASFVSWRVTERYGINMDIIEGILSNLLVFQIITDLIKVTAGAGLCFGALKWRRGLLTTTAIGWGLFLGILAAMFFGEVLGTGGAVICILAGLIGLPILTYTIPGVNRFVLGFLVSCKLLFMLTTVLAKAGMMDFEMAFALPLIVGTLAGLALMAWTKVRVSAFVLGCTFIGASEIAPVVSEWANRILFSVTGDYSYIFDPIDLFFALFKVELTDQWMLISMIILMIWGGYRQIQRLKAAGISLDTPLIGFESPTGPNGRIYTEEGPVDTMK